MLGRLGKTLADDEVVVVDAGVKISDLQEAGIECYVLRLATNFTARRNYLPDHSGKGANQYMDNAFVLWNGVIRTKRWPNRPPIGSKPGMKQVTRCEQKSGKRLSCPM